MNYKECSVNSPSFIGKRKNERNGDECSFFINMAEVQIELSQLYRGLEMEKKH